MNKAIFLDRDGTINIEKNYLCLIEDFEFIPGVIEGLKKLKGAGYLLFIITNQSGIARGYYTEDDFQNLNRWMIEELYNQGVDIEKVYYCPHLPNAKIERYRKVCQCRKPHTRLFEQAIKEYDLDIDNCYVIGDKIRDCSICRETDCKGFLISHNENLSVITDVKNQKFKGICYAETLYAAAMEITKK